MKITILTYGSSGDVIPYISLALGLMDSNHEVILAAPENFEKYILSCGVKYKALRGNVQELLDSEQGMKWIAAGNIRTFMKEFDRLSYDFRYELQDNAMDACKGADAIIGGTLMGYYAAIISEKLQIPFMTAFVNPGYVSTKAFPHFLVSQKIFPLGFLNSLTYLLVFKSYHKQKAPEFNEWRKKLGLGSPMALLSDARRKQKTLILNGFSPVLLQRPKDWDPQIEVTGIWKTDEKHKIRKDLPEGLANWIKAGTPPVYFGFGSMPVSNPEEMQKMIVEVCKEIGIRGIIHAGWSHFKMNENIPDDSIYFLNEFIDLEWLFPKCSILVHHGGVGTTHLGVESGTPTIICSIFADNPLWGEQLRRLNIGRHIRFSKLNKAKLIKAIKELQDEKIRANALKIGKKISAENGLRNAIDLIEKYLPTAPIYINNES